MAAAFKPLFDNECGVRNPLIELSQVYTHVTENDINKYDKSINTPNTFHLQTLLTNLHIPNESVDKHAQEWTQEFLHSDALVSTSINDQYSTSFHSEPILWNEENYIPSFPPLILPVFHDQQLSFIDNTEYENDTIRATQNILSFLQEKQSTTDNEKKTSTEENINLNDINPFEEGLKCLKVHDTANAILYFQSAVKKNPEHIDAWLYLGITQTENEQDVLAIEALKKCLELDSKHLLAYITLASCYANEMLIKESYDCLYKWLLNNKKYSMTKIIDELNFENLRDLFLQFISTDIDADLQICLGILFYLQNDFEKAAECFQTAILVKPNDALLWNKLGAAIANSGHSEKAIHTYYHALSLSPGFIRARYNLGISCLNLNAYQQAIEHFLIALKQQNHNMGNETIWQSLATAIHHLKRYDLEQCVAYKDLRALLREFEIE